MNASVGVAGVTASPRSKRVRMLAALLSAGVAALYVVVFFIQLPHMHETDNPAPIFVPLALAYIVGALLLTTLDLPLLHWVGVAVQVVILGLFAWILVGSYSHGGLQFWVDMLWLVITITAAQLVILGMLIHLAVMSRGRTTV